MTKEELYLKTIFCCMACDGDIAEEEITLVRELSEQTTLASLSIDDLINQWINEINQKGGVFLREFLNGLSEMVLTEAEQLQIIDYAIQTIEADHRIEYSEVKFFKKIRARLSISDEKILEQIPSIEDFLLPDINVAEEPTWDTTIKFNELNLRSPESSL